MEVVVVVVVVEVVLSGRKASVDVAVGGGRILHE